MKLLQKYLESSLIKNIPNELRKFKTKLSCVPSKDRHQTKIHK